MFTISTKFLKYRGSAENGEGAVALTVTSNRKDEADYKLRRDVRLNISGADKSIIANRKEEVLSNMRLLYCVVERLHDSREEFSLDDIVADFSKAKGGDAEFAGVIAKAETTFPLRADIVSIGREFRGCFEYVYTDKESNPESLSDYIEARIRALKEERKNSRARAYEYTHTKLKEFSGRDNLDFSHINKAFITDFAEWLKSVGIIVSTQSFYLRTLRSILNHAHADNLFAKGDGWFTGIDTKVLFERTSCKESMESVGRNTILKIKQLDLGEDKEASLTRDMFMFGFYCQGMELVDIAHLTSDNIRGKCLIYRKRQAGREIIVPLDPDAVKIINRYKTEKSRYLFPFLYDDNRFAFASMRNQVQIEIKKIGKAIGFPGLTFSMNIAAYRNMMSHYHISNLLDPDT